MTTVQFNLPDAVAQRARSQGLLTDEAIRELLEDAMRRQAGRRLMQLTERLHAANIEAMTDEQIDAEVQAARAQRRGAGTKPPPATQ